MANNLRLRREDYPAIGNILLISLKRDINDFTKEYKTIRVHKRTWGKNK